MCVHPLFTSGKFILTVIELENKTIRAARRRRRANELASSAKEKI